MTEENKPKQQQSKEYMKEYLKNWREKNREKYNASMSLYKRNATKELKELRKTVEILKDLLEENGISYPL